MRADDLQRKHLEKGIYRKRIYDAYFDATQSRMKPDDCIREAIGVAAITLLNNRSVELRGLHQRELTRKVWDRMRSTVRGLHSVEDFCTRSWQVVAVVTRLTADVAFDFWDRNGELPAACEEKEIRSTEVVAGKSKQSETEMLWPREK